MAKHKFDGRWRYYDIDDGDFPPDDVQEDGTMVLVIDDDGTGKGHLKPGSTHEGGQRGNTLTGDAEPRHLAFRETDGNDVDISYDGYLLYETGNRLVLVGTWKDHADGVQGRKTTKFLDEQNDGTWVMTKP